MVSQTEFTLRPRTRGFHLITDEVVRNLPPLPQTGLLYLFIKHTSAALSINENADPDVRTDMESIFNHLIKERVSIRPRACFSPSYNKVKSQTKHVWLLTLL